jgi:hypothetical protein
VEMNLQSVSEESQIVSDVQQRLRKYTANIFESGSAPLSAISSLHKVRGKLSSDLKSYDHLLEVMKDYHIQVVTIQEVLDAFSDKLGEASTYDDADMNTIITTLVNAAKESHIPVFDGTINHLVTGTYEDKTSTVSASVFAQDRCKVPQSPHRSTGTWSADKDEVVHKDKDHQRAGASPRNSALQRGHKILDIADGCDILWKARAKVNNDSDDNADDDRYPGGTVSEYRSYVYSKRARQPEYFLPAEGLNREVLQHEITRYYRIVGLILSVTDIRAGISVRTLSFGLRPMKYYNHSESVSTCSQFIGPTWISIKSISSVNTGRQSTSLR